MTAIPENSNKAPLLSEFHKFAIPTAYGIHHRINEKLVELFEQSLGHGCFFFYEYILDNPVTILDDFEKTNELKTQSLLAPFLRRYAHKIGLMPSVDLEGKCCKKFKNEKNPKIPRMVPITRQNMEKFWRDDALVPIDKTAVFNVCVKTWKAGTKIPAARAGDYEGEPLKDGVYLVHAVKTPRQLRKTLKDFQTLDDDLLSLQLREFALVLNSFLQAEEQQQIQVLAYSLSSDAVFWGACLVIYPRSEKRRSLHKDEFIKQLNDLMVKEISEIYAPVLMLLLNTVYEKGLDKELTTSPDKIATAKKLDSESLLQRIANGDWKHPDGQDSRTVTATVGTAAGAGTFESQLFKRILIGLNRLDGQGKERWEFDVAKLGYLEKGLLELWSERELLLSQTSPKARHLVRETLLFSKYFVASPALVDGVQKAIRLRHQRSKSHPNVVSALVIGGPGSGKDTMAKLIWLFSPGFRFGGLRTLNMAMFRPKEAAVPLLLGLSLNQRKSGKSLVLLELEGLLLRAMRDYEENQASKAPSGGLERSSPRRERGFAFILDELNSLDIDTQGALLRFMENAELTPLGGVKNPIEEQATEGTCPEEESCPECAADILVIGVMNEDPHLIMKRQAMDRILQQSELFGTLLGQTLHEFFRSQRRLRDDLYYRLIRGGEITMPSLRQRLEDIPILLYNNISRFDDLFPEGVKDFEVELSVYDILMDPSLAWEGNLRELQTISRNLVIEAKTAFEKEKHDGKRRTKLIVRGVDARKVLKRHQDSRAHLGSTD